MLQDTKIDQFFVQIKTSQNNLEKKMETTINLYNAIENSDDFTHEEKDKVLETIKELKIQLANISEVYLEKQRLYEDHIKLLKEQISNRTKIIDSVFNCEQSIDDNSYILSIFKKKQDMLLSDLKKYLEEFNK